MLGASSTKPFAEVFGDVFGETEQTRGMLDLRRLHDDEGGSPQI